MDLLFIILLILGIYLIFIIIETNQIAKRNNEKLNYIIKTMSRNVSDSSETEYNEIE